MKMQEWDDLKNKITDAAVNGNKEQDDIKREGILGELIGFFILACLETMKNIQHISDGMRRSDLFEGQLVLVRFDELKSLWKEAIVYKNTEKNEFEACYRDEELKNHTIGPLNYNNMDNVWRPFT